MEEGTVVSILYLNFSNLLFYFFLYKMSTQYYTHTHKARQGKMCARLRALNTKSLVSTEACYSDCVVDINISWIKASPQMISRTEALQMSLDMKSDYLIAAFTRCTTLGQQWKGFYEKCALSQCWPSFGNNHTFHNSPAAIGSVLAKGIHFITAILPLGEMVDSTDSDQK